MSGTGIGELIWLTLAILLGLGVVIAWIIKAEMNRNYFLAEIKRLRSQVDSIESERGALLEEIQTLRDNAATFKPAAAGESGASSLMIAEMMKRTEELERENARLRAELNEARSSLEEVYKAMCEK